MIFTLWVQMALFEPTFTGEALKFHGISQKWCSLVQKPSYMMKNKVFDINMHVKYAFFFRRASPLRRGPGRAHIFGPYGPIVGSIWAHMGPCDARIRPATIGSGMLSLGGLLVSAMVLGLFLLCIYVQLLMLSDFIGSCKISWPSHALLPIWHVIVTSWHHPQYPTYLGTEIC